MHVRTGNMVVGIIILLGVGCLLGQEVLAQQAGWRASGQAVAADTPTAPPLPPLPDSNQKPGALPEQKRAASQPEKSAPASATPAPPSSLPGVPEIPAAPRADGETKTSPSGKKPGSTGAPSALSILDSAPGNTAECCPVVPARATSSGCCIEDVPFMFGDTLGPTGQVFMGATFTPGATPYMDIPLAGGARRVKIAENNRLLPTDRVYFQYNHFQNAFERLDAGGNPGVASLDQYTLGIEKTFLDGQWSCEVRMPFTGAYQADMAPSLNLPGLGLGTSHYGNLAVILKRHLLSGDWWALGGGVGVDIPLGSDVQGFLDGVPFAIDNEAVHLLPFGSALVRPTDRLFAQAFLQVDVPLNGNRVVVAGTPIGELTEQTLMYIDAAIGYWLYQNPQACWLTGLAGVLEVHYTTTLQNADVFTGTAGTWTLGVGNVWNRMDVVNLTVGLHAQLGECASLGVGGVVPLEDRPERFFDAEVQVFFNYRY